MDKSYTDADVIAGARKRLGVTQMELARKAGVSQNLISAIERGVRNLVEPSRSRILNALREVELERLEAARHSELSALSPFARFMENLGGSDQSRANGPFSPEVPNEAMRQVLQQLQKEVPVAQRGGGARQVRESAGLSLDEMSQLVDISESTLSLYEQGKEDLPIAELVRWMDVIAEIMSPGSDSEKHAALKGRARRTYLGDWMLRNRGKSQDGNWARRCAQLEEISRAKDRLIEEQKKLLALYEVEFAKQPEMLRHWANEIKLRKESESSFRKEIAELQTSLAVVPETVDARQENIDREQGE